MTRTMDEVKARLADLGPSIRKVELEGLAGLSLIRDAENLRGYLDALRWVLGEDEIDGRGGDHGPSSQDA